MKNFLNLSVALAAILPCIATAQEDVVYTVTEKQLECLITHADAYLNNTSDVLIINIDTCPTISDDPLLDITQNVSPDLPDMTNELDRLVTLKKSELQCLAKLRPETHREIVKIRPARCEIVTE